MRRTSLVLVLLGLAGCYASEKMGKDIQDTSHDVNQGGIYMHKGGLGVYRPEPPPPQLTNASLTKAAGAATASASPDATTATAPAPVSPAPQKELPLPRKEDGPAGTQWPAAPSARAPAAKAPSAQPLPSASDAGTSELGAFSL